MISDFRISGLTMANAIMAAEFSQAAYLGPQEFEEFIEPMDVEDWKFFDEGPTQAYVACHRNVIVASFRGTEPNKLEDWKTDVNIWKVGNPLGGKVHQGFYREAMRIMFDDPGHPGVLDSIERCKEDIVGRYGRAPKIVLVGHSLGGGLATMTAAEFRSRHKPVHAVYTFGSPRCGDREFAQAYDYELGQDTYRIVNNNDVVSRLPLRSMSYKHVGRYFYLNEAGTLLTEDPSAWHEWLEAGRGRINDALKRGLDGIKDHALESGEDGYLPALRRADPVCSLG